MIVGVVVLLLLAALFIIRWYKKRKLRERPGEIPLELLKDFIEAEKRIREANGSITPYQVLWEIARERSGNKIDNINKQIQERIENKVEVINKPAQEIKQEQIETKVIEDKPKKKPKVNWEEF